MDDVGKKKRLPAADVPSGEEKNLYVVNMLLSVTVLKLLVIYGRNIGWKFGSV
jgi:hypothetical protein